MLRRDFIAAGVAWGAGMITPSSSEAFTQCIPHAQVGRLCESGIDLSTLVYASQSMNQLCWAASVQMAFAQYGYSISQFQIVAETYGVVANIPAVTGYAISKNLQRDWVDDSGQSFSVEIDGLYDFDAGIMGITDNDIVGALDAGRPIIWARPATRSCWCPSPICQRHKVRSS